MRGGIGEQRGRVESRTCHDGEAGGELAGELVGADLGCDGLEQVAPFEDRGSVLSGDASVEFALPFRRRLLQLRPSGRALIGCRYPGGGAPDFAPRRRRRSSCRGAVRCGPTREARYRWSGGRGHGPGRRGLRRGLHARGGSAPSGVHRRDRKGSTVARAAVRRRRRAGRRGRGASRARRPGQRRYPARVVLRHRAGRRRGLRRERRTGEDAHAGLAMPRRR